MTRVEDGNRKFLFDGITELFYSPEIMSGAKEKIEMVREFLEENPEYSFVLYFNHISFNDPAVLVHVANLLNPKGEWHLLVPMSYSHVDTKSVKGFLSSLGMNVVKACGIEAIPVVQTYQLNNPRYGYTAEEARQTYVNYVHRLKELKRSNTPTGVLISPEGHRSDTGKMMVAESGMVAAGRLLAPVVYVPLAVSYEGKFKRDGINIGKKMWINIGEVTVQENPREYPSVEELMKKLAVALPEEMRGVWG
ncbi:TPA: hypothetical protein DCP77_02350 [Candidatus Collierbacteria bacterium]|uniref:Phospholipid/glycerol acyltransferase domain-containing protein n=1 Tax=Candidatus Collierbacteria bacterium GW2011_GWA2_42_17 TaxID=1618378 RepID=A0A0G0Z3U2_9BACT|nr:MAG: hypothetical protein UU94_C0001G0090 [Candidatus Collierbacteria bacterium GW2011_GWB2_42_12]KKS43410.1 MAG: hypothetical protein UV06_C0001G0144 [Candidatus Collierbacteria bacterium GW2011_GWA2_42_17]KKS62895.1 MAG: hypothetical protein UV30_C0009G0021 [Candidatus Collierbacteria bacterium GW2011_GWF1_42_50]KKS63049.1 MAG: hypothetical protein UV29_C0007G0022 [Candidatus Collierbacteria bacterium GW2011_GWD2_42_50]KKS67341.1 MAG: hypothetical protein UV37_C0008G0006 [Candidatus Collie